ncbi:halocyanin domain-containing protein [Halorussus gelatinilyticus]|uniref:Halocyanin domain-containing protein n=1 Tax=Halorussus gelatinilyticus TaxID=2937524 RepID=A0A8U0IL94_9EURY|nr:halocyanin domain-containing protein [Halorussus gelatinilyticus]UPW01425.1 halocyanin domain-containing protein [Halorussus gelatinilyticus]
MTRDTLDRRTMLKTMAAGAATATIAGCSSGGSGDGGGSSGDSGGSSGDSGGSSGDGSGDSGGSSGSDSVSFDGWFDNTSNFDGVVDKTGSSEVTVKVGAKGNGGNFAFGPAAVEVSKGTKVVWKWTGKGSVHNVVADDGSFESKQTQKEGFTFSQTFDSAGKHKYYCTPHKAMGMKGAIVVE